MSYELFQWGAIPIEQSKIRFYCGENKTTLCLWKSNMDDIKISRQKASLKAPVDINDQ